MSIFNKFSINIYLINSNLFFLFFKNLKNFILKKIIQKYIIFIKLLKTNE